MTLSEFITKYDGQKVGDGQCGSLVRAFWNEVDLTTPPSYTNSKDYWSNPVPGYDKITGELPHAGDIAIYDGHGAFPEGHSAIAVNGSQVFEQNADPDGSPAHIFNRATTYLLGYLRKQGGSMSDFNDGDRTNVSADIGQPVSGSSWNDVYYNEIESWIKKYNVESPFNVGDEVNVGNALGIPPANLHGKNWNKVAYELLLPTIAKLQTELAQAQKPATKLSPGLYQV